MSLKISSALSVLVLSGAALLLSLGAIVCVGWYTGLEALIQVHPSFVPMQFNTALGFSLLGLSLLSYARDYRSLSRWLAGGVILLGGLTLLEYLFNLNLYIDELFMEHYITVETSHPGRMAPNTALNFVLSGLGICFMSQQRSRVWALSNASFLGALSTGLGMVALLGYLFQLPEAYGWGELTRMAVHTAFGFILAGIVIILAALWKCLIYFRQLPPLLLPLVSGMTGLTITLSLWQALTASELFLQRNYGIEDTNLIAEILLLAGLGFSLSLSFAIWLAEKLREKVLSLREAQAEILALNQKLEALSLMDGLTNIPNRRFFDIQSRKRWQKANAAGQTIAIVLLDLDYFKQYNDHYGHLQGDQCLKQVAQTLYASLGTDQNLVARYGGEEFVLLLGGNMDATAAENCINQILGQIKGLAIPHEASEISTIVTASAGICVAIPSELKTLERIIEQADQTLYRAKSAGRNCVIVSRWVE